MRMRSPHVRAHTKVATNVSLRRDLVQAARRFEINISEVIEQALADAVSERERQAWIDENEDAIDAYNAKVSRRGVFSDGIRRF
jgi:antitoxin CcdA